MGYAKTGRSKKNRKPLDDVQKGNIVSALISDAEDYVDSVLAPQREKATRYYNGELFGNEEENRSQVVMTEVRDVVQGMMPSLMRVFLSTENAVEYAPRRADAVEQAEQATEFVNYLFRNENDGAKILWSVFLDALVRKAGIFKWYTTTEETVTEETYDEIDDDGLTQLEQDEELEIEDLGELLPAGFDQVDPMTGQPVMSPAIYNVKAKRTAAKKKYVVEAIPPEEFLIARNARDEDHADLIGHRKDELVSTLVAMGYDLDELMEHGQPKPLLEINQESTARNPALRQREDDATNLDPSMATIRYYEMLVRMDADGDGIAELHKVCSIGEQGKYVLHDEVVDDVNFAIVCPSPVPHMAIGDSIADLVMDIQEIKSNVVRSTLDSLSQSIFPRTAVVEGQVNMDDVLNNEMGAVIRMRAAGAVQPLSEPFVGQAAMPIIAYLDEVRAHRTGMSAASQGLDPDVLQSTTKAAVTATVSAAQERLEMTARLFADGGVKRFFRGFLRMVVKNYDKPRVAKLRGKWVEVDPSQWDADMDVVVNVGIGLGDRAEKIQILLATAANQKETLAMLGPDNPLCDVGQYRNTLGKILELNGIKDTETFYKAVTPEAIQMMMEQMSANKPEDPAVILAQVEKEKTMADIVIAQSKQKLDEMKVKLEDDRERDKNELDAYLRAMEMQAKYGAQVNLAEMKHLVERQRTFLDTAIQIYDRDAQAEQQAQSSETAAQQQGLAAQDQLHRQAMAERGQQHSETMAAQPQPGAPV